VKTRSHPTPLPIKIVVGLWLVVVAAQAFTLITAATLGSTSKSLLGAVIGLSSAIYQATALARLSRWPVLLYPTLATLSIASLYISGADLKAQYPILGPFALILPPVIFLALTLPYWGRMNWTPFGRSYRPSEDQVEVFT